MPRGLPRSAGALFVTALALTGLAVFFGDGSAYAPLVWIGGAATCAAGAALALGLFGRLPLPRLDGWGWAFVALLVAFVAWNGVSIVWSVQPDRSWEYFNRGLVYLAFAALGLVIGVVVRRAPGRSPARSSRTSIRTASGSHGCARRSSTGTRLRSSPP